ncbi:CHAD domain-containing protein [Bacteroidota bacterium]
MTGCIYAAINKQIKKLESYIKRFGNEVIENDIHDFRVAVKRLRAYRYFLRIANQANLKIGTDLEMAYLAAGRLRDTTNKSIYLKKIDVAKPVMEADMENLGKTKNVYLQEFKSVLNTNSEILQPISSILCQVSAQNKEFLISELNLIFSVLVANLNEELNKPDPDIDLHEVRKLYKKMSYLFELVNEFNPTDSSRNDQKITISVEKTLGTWHDMQVLKLEEGYLKSINTKSIEKLGIEFGIDNRDNLIQLAKGKLMKFQLVSTLNVD